MLNGLLDGNESPAHGVAMAQPAKRLTGPVFPSPKVKSQKTAGRLDGSAPAPPLSLITSPANAETQGTIQTGGIPPNSLAALRAAHGELAGSTAVLHPPPTVVASRTAANTAADTSIPDNGISVHDIAFALRLTWQPSESNTSAVPVTRAQADTVLTDGSESTEPLGVISQIGQAPGLGQLAALADSSDTPKPGFPMQNVNPGESLSSLSPGSLSTGPFWPTNSSLAPSPLIPAFFARSKSTVGSALWHPETLARTRGGSPTVGSALLNEDPVQDTIFSQKEDAPTPGYTGAPFSERERTSASPLCRAGRQETATTENELQTESSNPQISSQAEIELPESTKPPRSPAASSTSIPSSPGAPADDAENLAGGVVASSESNRNPSRFQITEKPPPIPASNPSSVQGVAGAGIDRGAEADRTSPIQTKTTAPQPQHPCAALAELETSAAVQTQPIREISFRLAAASANVDVQLIQRAGKVQVAVRTTDQELAQSLQTNLGELVGRLEDKGFRTETWTPGSAQHGSAVAKEASNSANSQNQSDNSSSQGRQQNPQQESNQRQQERWNTQLEETLSAPIATTQEEHEL